VRRLTGVSPASTLGLWLGRRFIPTLRIIALPGAARQLQSALLAPSPWGDLGGTSGSALAPHPAAGVDRMKCVFGCQGAKAKGMGEGIFSLHPLPHLRAQNATLI